MPWGIRLGTNEGFVSGRRVLGARGRSLRPSSRLLMLALDVIGGGGGSACSASVKLLPCQVAFVEVAHDALEIGRRRRNLAASQQEWPL